MPALVITILAVAELVLFLLPGCAVVSIAARKRAFSTLQLSIAAIVSSAALGYIAFWIYLASKTTGQIFSWAMLAGSLIILGTSLRSRRALPLFHRDFLFPLAYALCLSLFNLGLLYLFVNPLKAGVDIANVRFFPATRPGDNIIPFIFAQRIYDRAPIRPFCCGDWLSSDRPPLQAGIFLLQRPLRVAGNTGLQYQVLGTVLQCMWVCGVWTFLRAVGASRARAAQVIGLLAFCGFIFYNSVYVWPKLLAATFVLFTFAIVGCAALERRALVTSEVMLCAACFALALLAHPGSIFSAPAILLVLIVRRELINWKQSALAAAILGVAFTPWILYQKFYDPPGNRLLKMHLAGAYDPDGRETLLTIEDAYRRLGARAALKYKWQNIEKLGGPAPLAWSGMSARMAQREFIWNSIGVLNIGWLIAIAAALRRRLKVALSYAGVMIVFALLNLLVWCLILFGPGQTVTEHGSYADILLLSVGLAGLVLGLPRVIPLFLLAMQTLNLVLVWVVFRPVSFMLPTRAVVGPALQWPMLLLSLCAGGAVLWYSAAHLARRELTVTS